MTRIGWLTGAALVGLCATPALAEGLETSVRAGVWSGVRQADPADGRVVLSELWARTAQPVNDQISVRLEGWISSNPAGLGKGGADIREAALTARLGPSTITVGRQLIVWGRTDRVNPTDVFGARNYSRLTEEDGDQRLGVLAVSASFPVGGGAASLHWVPEFRASRLPQNFGRSGLPVREIEPADKNHQYALRYERFGDKIDWSVTYAKVADRNPWLDLHRSANGRPEVQRLHPRYAMAGGDLATTLGPYSLRLEGAYYDYDRRALGAYAARVPVGYVVAGIERDFPGQISVIAQGSVRKSRFVGGAAGPLAQTNATIHGAWRGTVEGGLVRVRKGFRNDKGAAEVSVAAFSKGGEYAQLKVTRTIRDGVRLIGQIERFRGSPESYFGRLRENSVASLTLRVGY